MQVINFIYDSGEEDGENWVLD